METRGGAPGSVTLDRGKAPASVSDDFSRELYEKCNAARVEIKILAERVDALRGAAIAHPNREVVANATLAYRHLEDASMRLGKALQALDGGVSVYDRASTVGA
ncbi:MAG: hypothetical protein JWM41_2876 [Gemmatimonadetes bacterium]|nr:hypothetical protein [Gemmatimonadota bacterium]